MARERGVGVLLQPFLKNTICHNQPKIWGGGGQECVITDIVCSQQSMAVVKGRSALGSCLWRRPVAGTSAECCCHPTSAHVLIWKALVMWHFKRIKISCVVLLFVYFVSADYKFTELETISLQPPQWQQWHEYHTDLEKCVGWYQHLQPYLKCSLFVTRWFKQMPRSCFLINLYSQSTLMQKMVTQTWRLSLHKALDRLFCINRSNSLNKLSFCIFYGNSIRAKRGHGIHFGIYIRPPRPSYWASSPL